ncbi:MAG: helicase-exonuclease AddAB subunit AddB [Lachnospiraceae bacterium]
MAVGLLMGPSGSGKTHRIFEEIIEQSLAHPELYYYMIVPEQATMKMQRELIERHPQHGTMNVDVVSFHRLPYHIFEEISYQPNTVLDDIGKSMIVQKILSEKQDELTVLKANGGKYGVIEEVKSVLSEFYQYQLHEPELERMLSQISPETLLYHKLCDLRIILQEFEQFLGDSYVTGEQLLELLSAQISRSQKMKRAVVYLDGFTGFSPVQYELIKELFVYAKDVTISVVMDKKREKSTLFHMSKEVIAKAAHLVNETKVKYREPVYIGQEALPRFIQSEELAHMECQMFRYPYKCFSKANRDLELHVARNPRAECEMVAEQICKLVRVDGYRYRDIAIIGGDLTEYQAVLEETLQEHQIPFFADQNRSIFLNPCIEALRALFEMVEYNFTYESVFRFLKTGMTSCTSEEVYLLENYVLEFGIRGWTRYRQPFVRTHQSMTSDELEQINQIREKFCQTVEEVYTVLHSKKHSVRDYMTAVYEFCVRERFESKLEEMVARMESKQELVLAKAYAQVYPGMMELFDQTVALLGDAKLPLKELAQILDAGFDTFRLGVIPASMDQVLVGDIQRSRIENPMVVFLVGANEGVLTKGKKSSGILTDPEREQMKALDVELSPTAKEAIYSDQLYLYLVLSKAKNRLFISYATAGLDGKGIRPSYLIFRIQTIFPQLKVQEWQRESDSLENLTSKQALEDYFISRMQAYTLTQSDTLWEQIYYLLQQHPDSRSYVHQLFTAAYYINEDSSLGKAVAQALYGTKLRNSVSRMEQYAGCAFAHFMRYGMQLYERKVYEVRAVDIGTMLHRTMEYFVTEVQKQTLTWSDVTDELRHDLITDGLGRALDEYGFDVFEESSRTGYMEHTLLRMAERTAWVLQRHFEKGDMEPVHEELTFNGESTDALHYELDDGVSMDLYGKIDRVDRYEDDANIYLRIVDYKTGNTKFDIVDMNYGLQIQLVVYMNAMVEVEKRNHPEKQVIPAGMFYYNIQDAIIERDEKQSPEDALLEHYQLNGYANSNIDILQLMERNAEGAFQTVPVKLKKDGDLAKNSKVLTTDQFEEIGAYVSKELLKRAKEMMAGNVAIAPYLLDQKTPCDYCEYRNVCMFETGCGGKQYRRLQKMKEEDILQKVREDRIREQGEGE